MFRFIEQRIANQLITILPDDTEVFTGLADAAKPTKERYVVVTANQLTIKPYANLKDGYEKRKPSFYFQVSSISANGKDQTYLIPQKISGTLVEIETPPGNLLTAGKDYQADDRYITFFTSPEKGENNIILNFRKDVADGYIEEREGRIELALSLFDQDNKGEEKLIGIILRAVLKKAAQLNTISFNEEDGFRYRFINPCSFLDSIGRNIITQKKTWHCVTLKFTIMGRLEIHIAYGEPARIGKMREIKTRIKGSFKGPIDAEEIPGKMDISQEKETRPIASFPIIVIPGIGKKTSDILKTRGILTLNDLKMMKAGDLDLENTNISQGMLEIFKARAEIVLDNYIPFEIPSSLGEKTLHEILNNPEPVKRLLNEAGSGGFERLSELLKIAYQLKGLLDPSAFVDIKINHLLPVKE